MRLAWGTAAIGIGLVGTLAACGASDELSKARDYCVENTKGLIQGDLETMALDDEIRVVDDGDSVIVEWDGDSDVWYVAAAMCTMRKVGASEADTNRVEHTTSLMGRQTATWDGYRAEWSYHPDSGLSMTIERD